MDHFTRLYQKHGDSVLSLDWHSKESQSQRFDALMRIGSMHNKSLLDVGCGFGDFYSHILNRNNLVFEYVGCDMVKEFVEKARHSFPHSEFHLVDFLEWDSKRDFDYVFGSGLFSLKRSNWEDHVQAMVYKMFSHCQAGVGVNFLSTFSEKQIDTVYYADPARAIQLLMNISRKLVLCHDYRPNDFTVFLYK